MNDTNSNGVRHIGQDDFDSVVLQSDRPVMVDFYADWCGPCKMAAPILDELSAEQSDVAIVKVNVDENREISQKYGVMSIPTIITFKDGQEFDRLIGFSGRGGYEDMIAKAKGE